MARINIEDSLFKDERFTDLIIKLQSRTLAIGALVESFILAQKWYLATASDRLVPASEWSRLKYGEEIISCGLAELKEGGVYVKGSENQFSWLIQRQEAGRKGGLAKAHKKEMELATASGSLASPSGSKPLPLSLSLKKDIYILSDSDEPDAIPTAQGGVAGIARSLGDHDMVINGFDFKPPYEIYPRKEGKNAARGKLKALIKTQKDFDDFCQAVKNYAKLMAGKEKQFIKHFSSFVGHKNGEVWRDYIELPKGISHTGIVPTRVIEREFK